LTDWYVYTNDITSDSWLWLGSELRFHCVCCLDKQRRWAVAGNFYPTVLTITQILTYLPTGCFLY